MHWCELNQMSLNFTKCKVINFGRGDHTVNGVILEGCSDIKDLRIHLIYTFFYQLHVDDICTRARRVLGLISRVAKSGLPTKSIVLLHTILIVQDLEYGSVV